jgi:hypothetical protein
LNDETALKGISIRGRFAFAMRCLELVLDKQQEINKPIIQSILTQFWTYTKSDRLDVWEEEIFAFDPDLQQVDIDEFSFPTKAEIEEVRRYYSSTSRTVRELISTIISIGRNNLYAATGEYSESTLIPTLHMIKLTESVTGQIPNLENFKNFSFSESNGWGNAFERKDVE